MRLIATFNIYVLLLLASVASLSQHKKHSKPKLQPTANKEEKPPPAASPNAVTISLEHQHHAKGETVPEVIIRVEADPSLTTLYPSKAPQTAPPEGDKKTDEDIHINKDKSPKKAGGMMVLGSPAVVYPAIMHGKGKGKEKVPGEMPSKDPPATWDGWWKEKGVEGQQFPRSWSIRLLMIVMGICATLGAAAAIVLLHGWLSEEVFEVSYSPKDIANAKPKAYRGAEKETAIVVAKDTPSYRDDTRSCSRSSTENLAEKTEKIDRYIHKSRRVRSKKDKQESEAKQSAPSQGPPSRSKSIEAPTAGVPEQGSSAWDEICRSLIVPQTSLPNSKVHRVGKSGANRATADAFCVSPAHL